MQTAIQLDARGLDSHIFIAQMKRMLQKLYPGQILQITATGSETTKDLANYCNQTGDELMESRIEGKKSFYTIRKKPQI